MDINREEIYFTTFNQDQDCFACGTNYGFKIYQTFPFKLLLLRDLGGGIRIIEMLYKSNFMALVGGGANPRFAVNKVIIWNDYLGQVAGEITVGSGTIRSVCLRQDKLMILTEKKIYVHKLQDLSLIKAISTGENVRGLFAFSSLENVVCYPSQEEPGVINFVHIEESKTYACKAHNNRVYMIEMNHQGDQLASVSDKGTIIRLINVKDGSILKELRRGTEHNTILSLEFSMNSAWLACTGSSGTTHVFIIGKGTGDDEEEMNMKNDKKQNKKSKLSFLRVVHTFFDSEWSYSSLKLPDKNAKIALQSNQKRIIALSPKGQYRIISYDQSTAGKVLYTQSFCSKIY